MTCKTCNKYFRSPILLPCGHNVCKEHIYSDKKSYTCNVCNKNHKTVENENGFALNIGIIDLIELNIHLGDRAKKENEIIQEFDSVIQDFKLINRAPKYFITLQVDETRNIIISRKKELFEKIQPFSEEMLKELNEFEADCLKVNSIDENEFVDKCPLELNDFEKMSGQWKEELRSPEIDH